MVSLRNNPNRINAENKCFNPFSISTHVCRFIYYQTQSTDTSNLWCAGQTRWSKVFFWHNTCLRLSILFVDNKRKNLPVNTIILSSNSLLFSSNFTDHLNRRKKQIMASYKAGVSLIPLLQFVFITFKPQDHSDKPRKTNGFEISLFLCWCPYNM